MGIFAWFGVRKLVSDDQGHLSTKSGAFWLQRSSISFRGLLGSGLCLCGLGGRPTPVALWQNSTEDVSGEEKTLHWLLTSAFAWILGTSLMVTLASLHSKGSCQMEAVEQVLKMGKLWLCRQCHRKASIHPSPGEVKQKSAGCKYKLWGWLQVGGRVG